MEKMWFEQDAATCHTADVTIDLMETFGERVISGNGPVNWPPRSCSLMPLDYFLWGYVKALVFSNKPATLDQFVNNIRAVIGDIQPDMLEKVVVNWTTRLEYLRSSRSQHLHEIIKQIILIT